MSWRDRAESRWAARGRTAPSADGGGGGPLAVTAEAFVARSAQALWDLMDDPASLRLVHPSLTRHEAVAGTGPGVGAQWVQVHGRELVTVEVLAAQPPSFLATVVTGSGPALRTRRWIEHTGSGCRVVWEVTVGLPAPTTPAQRQSASDALRAGLEREAGRWRSLAETGSAEVPGS